MKIAIIQPPSWGLKNPPFASAILSAFLRGKGHEVYKRDLNIELYRICKDGPFGEKWKLNESFWGIPDQVRQMFSAYRPAIEGIVSEIIASGARLVGFSAVWSSIQPAILLAAEIKRQAPETVILFGGPQCSITAEGPNILALPCVDFAVSGEGEQTFLELLEHIEGERDISAIKGIFYRDKGRVIYGGDRELIRDLNSLPFPDYDGYDLSLYEGPVMLPTYTSRGCPNRCIYCDEKILWKGFRHRSGRRIFEEVQWLVSRYGINRFEFCDSLVNGSIETLEEFCELVIATGLDIQWMGQATVRSGMTRELLSKIKRSGCFHLCFGMEHYSKELLQSMGKVLCRGTDFDALIRECDEVELGTGLNWMFGFLGETDEDFQADIDFFSRNAPYMKRVSVNPSPGFCGFTKGCEVYRDPEKFGVTLHEDSRFWESSDGSNSYPLRLDKYQRFCRHLRSLGIPITFEPFANEERMKGEYFQDVKGSFDRAAFHFEKSLREEGFSVEVLRRLFDCYRQDGHLWKSIDLYRRMVAQGLQGKEKYEMEKVLRPSFPILNASDIRDTAEKYDMVMVQAPAWGINTPPMATAALTSFMRKEGYRVLAQDLNITMYHMRGEKYSHVWDLAESLVFWNDKSEVLNFAASHKAFLEMWADYVVGTGANAVGFTIYGSSYHMSLFLADIIKEKRPDIRIIFGGPFVSIFMAGKEAALQPSVDVVVDGEGEYTLREIMERIGNSESLNGCPGTIQKGDGGAVVNGGRELIRDLDSLPYADFSDYQLKLYAKTQTLPAMSSRGCPNACIFCNERPFWKNFRGRSAASIFGEMRHQLQLYPHISFFEFHDSLINGNVRELEKLADLIIADGLKVQWAGQAAIRKEMTFELLVKLRKAGCISLGYGLETASTGLMERVGKRLSRGADPNRILEDGYRAGVQCSVNFMFGLPGESEEDFAENLRFLEKNRSYIGTVNPSPAFCGFSPGTNGYEEPDKYDINFIEGAPYPHLFWETDCGRNNYAARLERFERFCDLVAELGVDTTYPHRRLLDRDEMLKEFYLFKGEKPRALPHILRLLERDGANDVLGSQFLDCLEAAPLPLREIGQKLASNEADLAGKFRSSVQSMIDGFIGSRDLGGEASFLELMLAIDDMNIEYHLMLTEIHLNRGRFRQAEKTLERLIAVRPDYREGKSYLDSVRAAIGSGHGDRSPAHGTQDCCNRIEEVING